MHIIDSSVWVALFLDFDVNYEKAIEIFSQINDKIYLPYCVISEVATVLTYKHSKEQADGFLEFISDNEDVILIDNEMKNEIDFYKKINKRVSFTDASLVFLAEKFGLLLITFDKQMIGLIKKK
ncbi:type II toxin-antitoxin system VapC family toxin [Candidatus Parcubacteria bacterium]|nr:type II toxin-antitoxin system VapC family toxin [Candidatus Parcubacteria bacterium]